MKILFLIENNLITNAGDISLVGITESLQEAVEAIKNFTDELFPKEALVENPLVSKGIMISEIKLGVFPHGEREFFAYNFRGEKVKIILSSEININNYLQKNRK